MVIKRWDPFRDLIELPDTMSQILEGHFNHRLREDRPYRGMWVPAVDMCETEDQIIVRAELPGVDPEDMAVEIEDNQLILRGERRTLQDVKEENYYRIERSHGKFYRALYLPTPVEEDQIEAHYRHGILEIILPKIESARAKTIKVE